MADAITQNGELDYWAGTSFTTTAASSYADGMNLDAAAIATICAAPEAAFPVEFILGDGLRTTTVTITGCTAGVPSFTWGDTQSYAAGARLVFQWTDANTAKVCGCDDVPAEEIEGIAADTTNDIKQLEPTGVVPGNYGGAIINACGQLTEVPVGWPASAMPSFDSCCDDP